MPGNSKQCINKFKKIIIDFCEHFFERSEDTSVKTEKEKIKALDLVNKQNNFIKTVSTLCKIWFA